MLTDVPLTASCYLLLGMWVHNLQDEWQPNKGFYLISKLKYLPQLYLFQRIPDIVIVQDWKVYLRFEANQSRLPQGLVVSSHQYLMHPATSLCYLLLGMWVRNLQEV